MRTITAVCALDRQTDGRIALKKKKPYSKIKVPRIRRFSVLLTEHDCISFAGVAHHWISDNFLPYSRGWPSSGYRCSMWCVLYFFSFLQTTFFACKFAPIKNYKHGLSWRNLDPIGHRLLVRRGGRFFLFFSTFF